MLMQSIEMEGIANNLTHLNANPNATPQALLHETRSSVWDLEQGLLSDGSASVTRGELGLIATNLSILLERVEADTNTEHMLDGIDPADIIVDLQAAKEELDRIYEEEGDRIRSLTTAAFYLLDSDKTSDSGIAAARTIAQSNRKRESTDQPLSDENLDAALDSLQSLDSPANASDILYGTGERLQDMQDLESLPQFYADEAIDSIEELEWATLDAEPINLDRSDLAHLVTTLYRLLTDIETGIEGAASLDLEPSDVAASTALAEKVRAGEYEGAGVQIAALVDAISYLLDAPDRTDSGIDTARAIAQKATEGFGGWESISRMATEENLRAMAAEY